MPKTKTSKNLGKSSKGKSTSYRPGDDTSLQGIKEAIIEALFEADFDTFKGCIAILLEKFDYQIITKETGLSKTTLYRMCDPSSNPTMENIGRVLQFIESHLDEAA